MDSGPRRIVAPAFVPYYARSKGSRDQSTEYLEKVGRPLLIAVIGLVIVALAIGLNYLPGPASRLADDADQPPSAEDRKAVVEPAEQGRIPPPTFDVVRVNPEGDAVFAGRAEPGSTVVIKDNDAVIGEATPDERGEWVFVPETPLVSGSRRLSLEMRTEGQPPVASGADVVLVVPEHGRDIAGRPADGDAGALALSVPRDGDGASTVLQTPADSDPAGPLRIEVVDYEDTTDADGIRISGRSAPGTAVRVYLDDALLGEAVAGADGRWFLSPHRAPPSGDHTLRADQVAEGGKVVARVEVPFEPLALLTSTGSTGTAPGEAITVVPGHNLWRIAENRYGTGYDYTVIYEANRGQIKNPDLIYPGQVFTLPPPAPRPPATNRTQSPPRF